MYLAARTEIVSGRPTRTRAELVMWLSVMVVVLARLLHLGAALGVDESGFFLVGGQWARRHDRDALGSLGRRLFERVVFAGPTHMVRCVAAHRP
jgi:hypothetical protein